MIDIRKTVPEVYYKVSNIVITVAGKSKPLFREVNLTFPKHNSRKSKLKS